MGTSTASSPTASPLPRSSSSLPVLYLVVPVVLISAGLFALAGSRVELASPWKLRVTFESPWPSSYSEENQAAFAPASVRMEYTFVQNFLFLLFILDTLHGHALIILGSFACPFYQAPENEPPTEQPEPDETVAVEEPVRAVKRYSRLGGKVLDLS